MKSHPRIVVTDSDYSRLVSLLASPIVSSIAQASALVRELSRALVVSARTISPDIVTMNSRVEYCDESRRASELTLVYPWDADPKRGDVSVLAPLGTALLGLRVGATIAWKNPSGRVQHWTVLSLPFQPEALGHAHL
ncbi:MAG: nucleoside diphosphate kinase regulator [Polyangiales bacterium]